jgi:hypothetical protein
MKQHVKKFMLELYTPASKSGWTATTELHDTIIDAKDFGTNNYPDSSFKINPVFVPKDGHKKHKPEKCLCRSSHGQDKDGNCCLCGCSRN